MEFNLSLLRFGPVFLVMFALLATAMSQCPGDPTFPPNIDEVPPFEGGFPPFGKGGSPGGIGYRRSPIEKLRSSGRRCVIEPTVPFKRKLEGRRLEELGSGARAEISRSSRVRSSGTRSNGVRAERVRSGKVRAEKRSRRVGTGRQ